MTKGEIRYPPSRVSRETAGVEPAKCGPTMPMSPLSAGAPDRGQPDTPNACPGRFYVFAISASAIFLACLALWRSPVVEYMASAKISHQFVQTATHGGGTALPGQAETTGTGHDPAAEIAAEITAESNLKRVLDELAVPTAKQGGEAASDPAPLTPEQLRQRLKVSTDAGHLPGQQLITVSYTGRGAKRSVALVENLARHYVQSQSQAGSAREAADEPYQQALREADVAHLQALHAHGKLDAFLADHFDRLQAYVKAERQLRQSSPVSPPWQSGTDADNPYQSEGAADAQSERPEQKPPGAAWLGLRRFVDQLTLRRDQLLVDRTPAHPEVQGIQLEIEKLNRRLAEMRPPPPAGDEPAPYDERSGTPQRTAGEPRAPPPADNRRVPLTDLLGDRLAVETVAHYETLRQACDAAHRRHNEATRTERSARQRSVPPGTVHAAIVEPARLAKRQFDGSSSRRITLIGILALIIGSSVSFASRVRACEKTIASEGQADKLLGVPVVGAISTTDGPPIPKRGSARVRLVHGATLAAELTVAAFFLGFVVSAMADRQFAVQFAQDPLAAFYHVMHQLSGQTL